MNLPRVNCDKMFVCFGLWHCTTVPIAIIVWYAWQFLGRSPLLKSTSLSLRTSKIHCIIIKFCIFSMVNWSRHQLIKCYMQHSINTMEMRTYFKKQTFNDSRFSIEFIKIRDLKKPVFLENSMKSTLNRHITAKSGLAPQSKLHAFIFHYLFPLLKKIQELETAFFIFSIVYRVLLRTLTNISDKDFPQK